MFTVEIKINGALISHIYGHNEGGTPMGCKYRYEYYETETRTVINGSVIHQREKGIRDLIGAILNDVSNKQITNPGDDA